MTKPWHFRDRYVLVMPNGKVAMNIFDLDLGYLNRLEAKAALADELLAGDYMVVCKWCGGYGFEPHLDSMAAKRGEHAHRSNCPKACDDALKEQPK